MAPDPFHVGEIVHVSARTGPGINQPGGVARITALSADKADVKYILDGRSEKNVNLEFLGAYQQRNRLRDRNVLLGRCSNCGSLRKDCDSCDIRASEGNRSVPIPLDSLQTLGSSTQTERQPRAPPAPVDPCSEDGDSDDTAEIWRRSIRRDRLFQRFKQRRNGDARTQQSNDDHFQMNEHGEQSTELQSILEARHETLWNLSTRIDRERRRKSNRRRPSSCHGCEPRALHEDDTRYLSVSSQGSIESEEALQSVNIDNEEEEEDDSTDMLSWGGSASDGDRSVTTVQDDLGFIEPEGTADMLPADIVDQTIGMTRLELLAFFDTTMEEIERKRLPHARTQLRKLRKQVKEVELQWQNEPTSVQARILTRIRKLCSTWYVY